MYNSAIPLDSNVLRRESVEVISDVELTFFDLTNGEREFRRKKPTQKKIRSLSAFAYMTKFSDLVRQKSL